MYSGSAGQWRGSSSSGRASSRHAAPSPAGRCASACLLDTGASIAAVSLGPGRVLGGEGAGEGVRRKGKGEEDLADG